MIERDWRGLYADGWNGQITPDAYAHPAKFARGLIRRIYQHALEQGYLRPGDVVLDCFGGVGLGALDAISLGLDWVGVELEEKFVKLGQDNITLWEHQRRGQKHIDNLPELGVARLLQGDSRYLGDVLGEAGGLVSSPPFSHPGEQPCASQSQAIKDYHAFTRGSGTKLDHQMKTPGQLGAMRVVSSPPYAESVHDGNAIDPDKLTGNPAGRNSQAFAEGYGDSAGQLGRMRVVSSPPYEGSHVGADDNPYIDVPGGKLGIAKTWHNAGNTNYGSSNGQLGTETGNDFWHAARQIMQQVAHVLPPGAVAVWVVKGFVRNKEYVDFPDQWRQLGEACGFETLEWIRAWLVEDRGTQYGLFGGETQKTVQRKSFFRRLVESKGSPPIDYEVVLIQGLAR